MIQIKFIAFIFITFFINQLDLLKSKDVTVRKVENINQGWEYIQNNEVSVLIASKLKVDAVIDLPHTWNQFDAVDQVPGYRRDASWYKKSLKIGSKKDSRYVLYFEGSNITTEVYVNNKFAGEHIGGYVGFRIDITNYIKENKLNDICIRVDNSFNPDVIPSQKADFFIYGGIVRDLWLEKLPNNYLLTNKISTPKVSNEIGEIKTEVDLVRWNTNENLSLKVSVKEPGTNKVISTTENAIIGTKSVMALPVVKNPKLWSPDDPNLYTVEVALFSNGKLIDQKEDRIGFRWFEFKPNGPFYLNGKRLLIRGTHRHEDHAGYAQAMPNDQHYKDMQQIKDMGANFVRLAHYPQDPEVYKACDELGIIVWDELPWCRGGMGEEVWQKNTLQLFNEQIIQNYNHPSIFFWSVGNEIYWLPDFEKGDDKARLNGFISKLHNLAHELDPFRLTSIRKHYDGADLVDVFSPSIWSGWYAGIYKNYEKTLEENQKKYKHMLHMEYGGTSHVGRHTENPIDGIGLVNETKWEEVTTQVNLVNIAQNGDNSENYMVDLFDWYLRVTENKDDFTGNAQWAFKDFGTPLRPEDPIPYMNQKGIMDRAGNPKDVYYVFQSYWAKKPMIWIESHTWTERYGNEDKVISVYSNCPKAKLIVNGKELEIKTKDTKIFPAGGYNWQVTLKEGSNTLEALAFDKNESTVAKDKLNINFTKGNTPTADHIELSSSILPNGNYLVTALAVDKNGKRALTYEKKVYFTLDKAGKLYGEYGYPGRNSVIEMSNGKAYIEVAPSNKEGVLEVRNHDFKGAYITIPKVQI